MRGLALCLEVLKEAQGALISATRGAQGPLVNVTAKTRAEDAYYSAWDCLRREIPIDAVAHVLSAKSAMSALKALIGTLPGLVLPDASILEPYAGKLREAIGAIEELQRETGLSLKIAASRRAT